METVVNLHSKLVLRSYGEKVGGERERERDLESTRVPLIHSSIQPNTLPLIGLLPIHPK